jgi:hypothetical protein
LPEKLLQLIQVNQRRSYGFFAAPMTRTTALIWLTLMWMAISAILMAALVVLFQ